MKLWNAPELMEIDITETASGDVRFPLEGVGVSFVNGKWSKVEFGPNTGDVTGGNQGTTGGDSNEDFSA